MHASYSIVDNSNIKLCANHACQRTITHHLHGNIEGRTIGRPWKSRTKSSFGICPWLTTRQPPPCSLTLCKLALLTLWYLITETFFN